MRLSGWSVPIEYLSASALSQFIQCPESWRLRRLQRIPDSNGLDKFVGLVDHETHAVNLTRKITEGNDLPATQMDTIYDESWDNELSENGEPDWYGADPDKTREHGHLVLQTYHELVSPTINPIAVESRFEETIPGLPLKVVGYVDVEEKDRLVERKTVKARVRAPKPNWQLQGRIYSLIYQKPVEWSIVTRQVTPQVITAEQEPGLRMEVGNQDSTVLLMKQTAEMINDMYVRYGPDSPWPTHGLMHPFACSYCGFGPKYGGQCIAWKEEAA